MAQLQLLSFDKIGSLIPEQDGTTKVGPCFEWDEHDDGSISVSTSGPFSTIESYLDYHWQSVNAKSPYGIGAAKLARAALYYLPASTLSSKDKESPYIVAFPDFDIQNVMIDESGNVLGFLDWDLVQTMPRFVGIHVSLAGSHGIGIL